MKKVAVFDICDNEGGGVTNLVYSLIESLESNDELEFTVFSNRDKIINPKIKQIYHIKERPTFLTRVKRFLTIFFKINFSSNLLEWNKEELNKFDLIFTPYISPYPSLYLNKDFVFMLHDLQEKYFPSFFSRKELFLRKIINKAMIKNSKGIICESEFVKRDILKFYNGYNPKVNVLKIPPANFFKDFMFNDEDARVIKSKYKLPDSYLYYPAQFWSHKNHINLLRAVKILKNRDINVNLVFSGSDKGFLNQIKSNIKELNLTKNVVFTGYIDFSHIPYLYKLSNGLVLPSLFESISIPVFEAIELNVPIISSNLNGLIEQTRNEGVYFDPENCSDIAEKIEMLFLDNKIINDKMTKIKANYDENDKLQFKKSITKILMNC